MNGQKNAFILASCGFVLAFGIAATVVLPTPRSYWGRNCGSRDELDHFGRRVRGAD